MHHIELIQSAKKFIGFWIAYAALIWIILYAASLLGNGNVTIHFHILILLSMLLAGATALALDIQQQRRDAQLALFISKLQDLKTDNTRAGHIISRPGDPLTKLAEAINDVQRLNRDRIKLLQQQGSTLAALMAHMPLGALRITPERTLIQINNQARTLLGVYQDDILGRDYSDILRNHRLLALLEQSLKRRTHVRELIKFDNRMIDVSVVYYETRERHHELLVLLYDMTEVTQMQDMQSAFITNASHELRTPLTAISGFTETLLDGAQEDPEARQEFLEVIRKESNRLLALTEDILTLAKTPERADNLVPVAVSEIVAEVFQTNQQRIDNLRLTMRNEVSASFSVVQDETLLRQILTNLITNAVKYNQPGGSVKVSAMTTATEVVIAVKDSGLGISSEEQARVFERFYRVDKSRNQIIPGTGLGLSIVKELVEQAKGSIDLDSQVGVGTTVTVTLPLL